MELYEPLQNQLYGYCKATTGNVHDAKDLLQDTILAAWEGWERLKNKAAFKAYLFKIAHNLYKMKIRMRKPRPIVGNIELSLLADENITPELLTDYQIIFETIHKLPEKTAEALILFHISDLSLKEIQKVQGGSLSAVKQRLRRGREKLLAMLNSPSEVSVSHFITLFA